jgi:alkaline phosphatase D
VKRLAIALTSIAVILAVGATPTLASRGSRQSPKGVASEFPYGVGSNDVQSTTALVWTRDADATELTLTVSTDPGFAAGVRTRRVAVSPDHDGTVLVQLRKLQPGTRYYFRFRNPATNALSAIGTFGTAPGPGQSVDLTFDYSGDQDGTRVSGSPCFNDFESFATILAENPDFYINNGDTIYSDSGCKASPSTTLDEYRDDYKSSFSFQNLTDLRAGVPFYTNWDDHEVKNDFTTDTVPPAQLAAAIQAFEEYDAMRPPRNPSLGYYRRFQWGTEAELFILDERSFRSPEANRIDTDGDGRNDCYNPDAPDSPSTLHADLAPTLIKSWRDRFGDSYPSTGLQNPVPRQCLDTLNAPGRTMLGETQRSRFLADLRDSPAVFKLVVNEDPIQQFFALPYDRWEGYRWERSRILRYIQTHAIENVVWLSTDVHAYIANHVGRNTDTPGYERANPVMGMVDYTVGPIATNTFRAEINAVAGAGDVASAVHGFLVFANKNICGDLGGKPGRDPGAPFYGYGHVEIDAATHSISIYPRDHTGYPIAENGQPTGGRDYYCYDYHATAS